MKLEEMQTTADALRWALHRLETAGVDCGDYFAKADAILARQPRPYVSDEASKGEYATQCLPATREARRVSADREAVLSWLDARGLSVTAANVTQARAALAAAPPAPAEMVRELVEALEKCADLLSHERVWPGAVLKARALIAKHKEQA